MVCFGVVLFYILVIVNYTVQDNDCLHERICTLHNRSQTTENMSKVDIDKAAKKLKEKLEEISREEMGLDALHDVANSEDPSVSGRSLRSEFLVTMVKKLESKVEAIAHVLQEMKRTILNSTEEFSVSFLHPCPSLDHRLENIEINNDKVMLNIPKVSCKACAKHLVKEYGLKVERQGYLSVQDGGSISGCRESSTGGGRRLLHHAMQAQRKTVIIMLDRGSHMVSEGLDRVAAVARDLVELLEPADVVALLQVDHRPSTVSFTDDKNNCSLTKTNPFHNMTESMKRSMARYLSAVEVGEEPSNLTAAMAVLQEMLQRQSGQVLVVYLGRKSHVVKQAASLDHIVQQLSANNGVTVIFGGCSAPDTVDFSPLITFNNVNLHSGHEAGECSSQTFLCSDWLINLNTSQTPGEVASRLLLKLSIEPLAGSQVSVAPPHWEPAPSPSTLTPLLIPFYLPIFSSGVAYLNVFLSDLAEDIIYFNSYSTNHRAFLIDFSGNVIAHSSFPRPDLITKPRVVHISTLEEEENFNHVKSSMFGEESGEMTVQKSLFMWKWVQKMYIMCVVTDNGEMVSEPKLRGASSVPQELQHHRMDLLPPANSPLCRHFLTVSTIHRGTLYLSPSSFLSPFTYLYELHHTKDPTVTFVQNYMAYLKDDTSLLSNPGLKGDVREEVGRLNHLLAFFKEGHIKGLYNKYIVRRYATSEHGVLVLFPGTILESDFEPNRKPWFLKALRNPTKVILTPPYLDIGGAGYIVTISQSPMGKSPAGVVVSIDMTMSYLYKMLQEMFPVCADTNVRCFLMDDRGYLLSHPGLVDPSNLGPIEQTHITHKESHTVNDMFNHKGFVTKKLCKNFADSTLQRFYQFNMSLERTLTNFVQGDQYARYYIAPVSGTNIFIGMVNSSTSAGVFCPCSVENRLCLNCNRMEQDECECPCECQLPEEECFSAEERDAPLCEYDSERYHRNNFYTIRYNLAPHLDSCFDFQCESYSSKQSCLGVLGCEWCLLERDRETPLVSPFCTAQPHCFGGVLSGPTPYQVGFFGHVTQDDLSPAYSAVGPIVGCIVALCLILALAVYCYRQNLPPTESEVPFPTPQDTWPHVPVHSSHLPLDEDVLDDRSGHQDQLLLAVEPPVSPYRILTGYRRPPTTGESDHGYSTMTPHDDSEHQAFALVEPPSSPSLSTPRSSATDVPLTVLPCGKNNILAPVTVHRLMEST